MFPHSINLNGADQVERAARLMEGAARQMSRAAEHTEAVLQQHQRFLDDWLTRFEAIVEGIGKGD
jgi:hypothetical protein